MQSSAGNRQEYIFETIKEENIINWMKSGHDIDSSINITSYSQSIRHNQNLSNLIKDNPRTETLEYETAQNMSMKKKIPQKKGRSESQSLKKRSAQSLDKKR